MDELNEVAQALHGLCMAQQGQIEALGVMMDAVIGVIGQNLPPLTPALAVILVGGLRELTALAVEDGGDVQTIVAPAVDASIALLGGRA